MGVDIGTWLAKLGLERYEQAFKDNDIVPAVLSELTDQDLKELGISLGHRRLLLKAIRSLAESEVGHGPADIARPASPLSESAPPTEAERRQLTILFCDLVGSTTLSAQLDPEDMREVISTYQNACADIIARFEGYVAKYMGDGLLAYFGYPRAHEDDAERAVRAGLELVEAIPNLTTPAVTPLAARVGIATGQVVVGDLIGEGLAQEEAVIGETPNLAARLQATAKAGAVVVAPATRQLLGQLFELVDLGAHELKGFAEPIEAWQITGVSHIESRFEAQHGSELTPLIGRDEERNLLHSRWRQTLEEDGQVVLLSGEPGIGKSRIAESLRAQLADDAHVTLRYFCSPFHINTALQPIIDQLQRAAGFGHDDSNESKLDLLEAVLSKGTVDVIEAAHLLARALGISTGERYPTLMMTPQQQKQRTVEVLLEQLEGLATQGPVLMIFEDAHWIDPSTLELLAQLVERIARLPVLLLITFRPEFHPPWIGYAHVTQLSLNRLSSSQGAAMVERLAGGKQIPVEVLDQVLAKTDGVPLFVEELTKTILESGLLTDVGDHYELSGPLPELAIPSTLHDSLMARLDRLAPVKEVAQIGAVIGRVFSHELLAAVTDRTEPELDASLDRLIASELIFRRGMPPNAVYTFKHALVQDTAYQSLLKSRRRILHSHIADIMERGTTAGGDQHPELIAHHLTEAQLVERAIPYWHRAGQRAIERSANIEAEAHLRRGLDLVAIMPATKQRDVQEMELCLELTVPLIAVHGFGSAEVEACATRARDLAEQNGKPSQCFAAARVVWNSSLMRQPLSKSIARAEELLALAKADGSATQRALAARAIGYTLSMSGRQPEALAELRRGWELADDVSAQQFVAYGEHPGVVCRFYGAWCCAMTGHLEEGLALGERAVTMAQELRNPHMVAWALACLGYTVALRRDGDAAVRVGTEGLALSEEHRLPQWIGFNREIRSWGLLLQGDIEAAVVEMTSSNQAIRATGATLHTSRSATFIAEGYLGLGDLRHAKQWLEAARKYWQRSGEAYFGAEIERLGALLLEAKGGSPQEIAAGLRRAVSVAQDQGARLFKLRALTDLTRLDHRSIQSEALAKCLDEMAGSMDLPDLVDAQEALAKAD